MHEPTDSYFYLAIKLMKCMMRADALNSHVYPLRTEMTALSSHVFSSDDDEKKVSLCTKLYHRVVLQTRTNQKASLSTMFIWRKINQNALLTNKKMKRMRLHMM